MQDNMSSNNNQDQSSHVNSSIEQELNSCKSELQQTRDTLLRISADFDNYKKRVDKERNSWIKSCQATILLDILPILDDFDRAFASYKKGEDKQHDIWIQGFELIYKALFKFLDKYNVTEIKDFTSFNPEYHEAISQVESDKHESGEIVNVVQKGYLLKDEVLRPAQVIVAK